MEKIRHPKALRLPEHLCESNDPLLTAKAYTLQLLNLAAQAGGDRMVNQMLRWIRTLNILDLEETRLEYETSHKIAAGIMPFIRADLKKLMRRMNCGYKSKSTSAQDHRSPMEVDGFLFEDLDDALENQGLPSDRICVECQSSDIVEISCAYESFSVNSMVNLFQITLKGFSPKSLCVLGSSEGALVYGSYLLTSADQIFSYEWNEKLLEIQNIIISKYSMHNRVKVRPLAELPCSQIITDIDVLIIGSVNGLAGMCNLDEFQQILKRLYDLQKIVIYPRNMEIENYFPILKEMGNKNLQEPIFSTQEFVICRDIVK